uniref:MTBp n=1 Tax=Tetrahymena canadensis TaxID=5894 RepID=A0A513X5B1_TETCN|nr:MTBp [Tetrahymena canadensis]
MSCYQKDDKLKKSILLIYYLLLSQISADDYQQVTGNFQFVNSDNLITQKTSSYIRKSWLRNEDWIFGVRFSLEYMNEDSGYADKILQNVRICSSSKLQDLSNAGLEYFEEDKSIEIGYNLIIEQYCLDGSQVQFSATPLGYILYYFKSFQLFSEDEQVTERITVSIKGQEKKFNLLFLGTSPSDLEVSYQLSLNERWVIWFNIELADPKIKQLIFSFPSMITTGSFSKESLRFSFSIFDMGDTDSFYENYSIELTPDNIYVITMNVQDYLALTNNEIINLHSQISFSNSAFIQQANNELGSFSISLIDIEGFTKQQANGITLTKDNCIQGISNFQLVTQTLTIGRFSPISFSFQIDQNIQENSDIYFLFSNEIMILGQTLSSSTQNNSFIANNQEHQILGEIFQVQGASIAFKGFCIQLKQSDKITINLQGVYVSPNQLSQNSQFQLQIFDSQDKSKCLSYTQQLKLSPSTIQDITIVYSRATSQHFKISFTSENKIYKNDVIRIKIPDSFEFISPLSLQVHNSLSLNSIIQFISPQEILISNICDSNKKFYPQYTKISFSINQVLYDGSKIDSSKLVQIEINNNYGVLVQQRSIEITMETQPLIINKVNYSYFSLLTPPINPNSNIDDNMTMIEVSFQIKYNYLPENPAFLIFLPNQLRRDTKINNVIVEFDGSFISICGQDNSIKLKKLDIKLENNQEIQNRDVIEINCLNGNRYLQSNNNSDYILQIQGYKLPKLISKPSDQIIIQLVQQSNSYISDKIIFQQSDHYSIPFEVKNEWVFINTIPTKFLNSLYEFTLLDNQNQFNPQTSLKVLLQDEIEQGDILIIEADKSKVIIIQDIPPQKIPQLPIIQNINCSIVLPSGVIDNSMINECKLIELSTQYQIQAQFQYPQNIEWNKIQFEIVIPNIILQPQINELSMRFLLFSQDKYIISFQEQKIQYNQQLLLQKIDLIPLNFQNEQRYYFEYQKQELESIQLAFQSQFLLTNEESLQLHLQINQQLFFNQDFRCSIDFCGLQNFNLNCILQNGGKEIIVEQFELFLNCPQVTKADLVIKIFHPQINLQSSNQPSDTFTINWSLNYTSSQQIILLGSNQTTLQLKCEQEECKNCVNFGKNCIECKEGYYLYEQEKKCVQQCPSQTSLDKGENLCKTCLTQQYDCLQCNPLFLNTCIQCAQNYSITTTDPYYCYLPPSKTLRFLLPSPSPHNSPQANTSMSSSYLSPSSSTTLATSTISTTKTSRLTNQDRNVGQQAQQEQEGHNHQQNNKGETGLGDILGGLKKQARGLLLTLSIPVSLIFATLLKLKHSCLIKKKGNTIVPIQRKQSQMHDTDNCNSEILPKQLQALNQQQPNSQYLQKQNVTVSKEYEVGNFSWIATLLFFANLGDLAETPYILIVIMSESFNRSFDLSAPTFSQMNIEQITILVYMVINILCYLYCLLIILNPIIFSKSLPPIFSIFIRNVSSSINGTKNNFNQAYDKMQDQNQLQKSRIINSTSNCQKKKNNRSRCECFLLKQSINFIIRCVVAALSKSFCILYTNVGDVKGWFTCSVKEYLNLFKVFHRILCIHTMFNILAGILFTVTLTHIPFTPLKINDDSVVMNSQNSIVFSSLFDLLIFKVCMSFICYANCLHIQALIESAQLTLISSSTSATVNNSTQPSNGIGSSSQYIPQQEQYQLTQKQQELKQKSLSQSPYSVSSFPYILSYSPHHSPIMTSLK